MCCTLHCAVILSSHSEAVFDRKLPAGTKWTDKAVPGWLGVQAIDEPWSPSYAGETFSLLCCVVATVDVTTHVLLQFQPLCSSCVLPITLIAFLPVILFNADQFLSKPRLHSSCPVPVSAALPPVKLAGPAFPAASFTNQALYTFR